MATRIYTKTGDAGETGLFGGVRVSKDNLRVEVYGTVDELNAVLGLARAQGAPAEIERVLEPLQNKLFELGAELATPPGRAKQPSKITDADVQWLEREIDAADEPLPSLKSFVLPGGTQTAATLHVARNVCRRAERRCVALRHLEPDTAALTVTFLNRLSDLLFVLARRANHAAGVADVLWAPRAAS